MSKKKTLIFLHGFLGSRHDFKPFLPHFEKNFSCHSFDLPGHNQAPLSCCSSFEDFIELISKKIKEITEDPCSLIGYSLGGRLALLFAKKYPELVDKLVIISSHLGLEHSEERKKRFSEDLIWADKLEKLSMDDFLKEWYDQPVFQSLKDKTELFEEVKVKRRLSDPRSVAKVLKGLSLGKQPPMWNELCDFPHPMLFLCGDEDKKYKELYEKIPLSSMRRVVNVLGAGHALHLEKPEEFIKIVIPFLIAQ